MYAASVIEGSCNGLLGIWLESWRCKCVINNWTGGVSPDTSYVPSKISSPVGVSLVKPSSSTSGDWVKGVLRACPKWVLFRVCRWCRTSVGTSIVCHSVHFLGSSVGSTGISIRVIPLLVRTLRRTCSFWNNCRISSAFLRFRKMRAFFLLAGSMSSSNALICWSRSLSRTSKLFAMILATSRLARRRRPLHSKTDKGRGNGSFNVVISLDMIWCKLIPVLSMVRFLDRMETLVLASINSIDHKGVRYLLVRFSADKLRSTTSASSFSANLCLLPGIFSFSILTKTLEAASILCFSAI